jgi:hypothetical protein
VARASFAGRSAGAGRLNSTPGAAGAISQIVWSLISDGKHFVFNLRSSAANLVLAFSRSLVSIRTGRQLVYRRNSPISNAFPFSLPAKPSFYPYPRPVEGIKLMTRVEIDRLTINFEIHKQNKGENAPGFVFANPVAEASGLNIPPEPPLWAPMRQIISVSRFH